MTLRPLVNLGHGLVYRPYYDATANGPSSRINTLKVLPWMCSFEEVTEEMLTEAESHSYYGGEALVVLTFRGTYMYCMPLSQMRNSSRSMDGGNYVRVDHSTSPHHTLIPIHDRVEG